MRVEITEKKLSDLDEENDRHYLLFEGDTITVPDKLGEKWCGLGWAKDVDGNVPTGERIVQKGVALNPKKAAHTNKTRTRGRA